MSNACPNCGWFAETITAWPRWVRQTTVEEATWATVHAAQDTLELARGRRPTLPQRTPWTPVPSRHRASAEPTLAVGTQVGYDPFRGCTVAVLHVDGSVDIHIPGVGIHSRVSRSAVRLLA